MTATGWYCLAFGLAIGFAVGWLVGWTRGHREAGRTIRSYARPTSPCAHTEDPYRLRGVS